MSSATVERSHAAARAYAEEFRAHDATLSDVLALAGISHEAGAFGRRRWTFADGTHIDATAAEGWHWVWTGRLPTDEEAASCPKCGASAGERCRHAEDGGLCSRRAS